MEKQDKNNWDEIGDGLEAHPPSELLLLYEYGELSPGEAAQVAAHLETCWECRVRAGQIEETITDFVEYNRAALISGLAPPPDAWRGFRELLEQRAEAAGRPSLPARLREMLTPKLTPPRLAVGVAALLLAAIVGLQFWGTTAVSAHELLQRSMQAEIARLNQTVEPILYRKLQVRRRAANHEESLTWESWDNAGGKHFRQRIADKHGLRFIEMRRQMRLENPQNVRRPSGEGSPPSLIAELEEVFRINHPGAQQPLSAAAYLEWRNRIRLKSETVTDAAWLSRGQGPSLMLTTVAEGPFTANAIIEASLIVRRADWRVVAQFLKVQGENEIHEYELSEIASEVVPLEALTVFAALAPTSAPANALAVSPTAFPSVAPSLTPTPTAAELREAEVSVLYALHQAQADLGEEIEAARETGGKIVVRGLVEKAERKQLLSEALKGIPHVVVQIQTVEEAVQQATRTAGELKQPAPEALNPAPESLGTATVAAGAIGVGVNPYQQKLAEHFGARGKLSESERQEINRKIAHFYNAVEADASAAMAEAWALRRMLERFPEQALAQAHDDSLNSTSRRRVEEMLRNHIARLMNHARRLRARMEPVLLTIAGAAQPLAPTQQASATAVFKAVEQIRRLTDGLIDGTGVSAGAVEQPARQLLAELARLDQSLISLEQELAK